jgi:hypothetical protein
MEHSPELKAALERVRVTFDALTRSRARVNRCRRDEAIAAAREAAREAELAYREAADVRDGLVEIERARNIQRGGDPSRLFGDGRSSSGPVVKAPR